MRASYGLHDFVQVTRGRVLGEGMFGVTYEGRWRGAKVGITDFERNDAQISERRQEIYANVALCIQES